jgi:hypothetical protein
MNTEGVNRNNYKVKESPAQIGVKGYETEGDDSG